MSAMINQTRTEILIGRRRVEVEVQTDTVMIHDLPGGRAGAAAAVAAESVAEAGFAEFLTAGWRPVRRQEQLVFAARSGNASLAQAAVRELARLPSGRAILLSNRLVVGVEPDADTDYVLERLAADRLIPAFRLDRSGAWVVQTAEPEPVLEVAARLTESGRYRYAEPDWEETMTGRWRPTDPLYSSQWQWRNSGAGGVAGADVRIEAAWDRTRGLRADGRPVRIAVIDTGFDLTHPDLAGAVAHGGHYMDDWSGSLPALIPWTPGAAFPDSSHGTACAGMAVARANNGLGGCGAAPESLLIPIACMSDQVGSQSTLARALAYAALPSREVASQRDDEGADVIVCSLGPNDADWILQSVLRDAIEDVANLGRRGLGTPLFWAVSNGTVPIARDEVVSHPAVIRVGRSSRFDQKHGSAYGPELDFLAPGAAVLTTTSGGGYGPVTGTSFAAPLAAGIGALVIARNPAWTATQLRDHLRTTCDQVGGVNYAGGHHPEYGYGRLNADRATI